MRVLPSVFYPHFTYSTKILLQFIEQFDLENKSFLEMGCGTGVISVLASKKGAKVTASDINPVAIENTNLNAKHNNVHITTILSDLFEQIPQHDFDYILINPPYYPKNPDNVSENAWLCGENFEYFENLFASISPYFNENSDVLMILSEDCEIERIKQIAGKNKLVFTIQEEKIRLFERNYIFKITKV
jgi:release factor glutamine methyltransferase